MKKNPYTEEHIFGNTTPYALKWESICPTVSICQAHILNSEFYGHRAFCSDRTDEAKFVRHILPAYKLPD